MDPWSLKHSLGLTEDKSHHTSHPVSSDSPVPHSSEKGEEDASCEDLTREKMPTTNPEHGNPSKRPKIRDIPETQGAARLAFQSPLPMRKVTQN